VKNFKEFIDEKVDKRLTKVLHRIPANIKATLNYIKYKHKTLKKTDDEIVVEISKGKKRVEITVLADDLEYLNWVLYEGKNIVESGNDNVYNEVKKIVNNFLDKNK